MTLGAAAGLTVPPMVTGLTAATEFEWPLRLVPPGRPLPKLTLVACGPLPLPAMPGMPAFRLTLATAGPVATIGLVVLPMRTAEG